MKIWITLFSLLFFNAAQAEGYGSYKAEVIRVIDGDSIEVRAHIWPGLTQTVKLRLAGVNTPEKRGKGISTCEKKAGQDATTFTQRWLKGAGMVTISEIRLGKYAGRVLGRVSKDGEYLGEALIKAGLAKPYSGGKRLPWC
mgnify:CR=1 FL=1|jgi:micrococcal nuclease